MEMGNLGIWVAFLAGLASFLSPCVFALVPAYVGYLSSRSVASARDGEARRLETLSHAFAFVLGFTVIFVLLGLSASVIGRLLYDQRDLLTKLGGIVVILFGLHMTGIIRIPFLAYDVRRQKLPDPKLGYLSSFLMGIFFSAGWSPCVGPVLGAIMTMSLVSNNVIQGGMLLLAYSAGLAIPFLIAATQISLVTNVLRKYGRVMHYVEVGLGVFLIAIGLMLFFGRFEIFASLGTSFGDIDEIVIGQYLLIGIAVLGVIGLIPAYIAYQKGRHFIDWWFFGALLFPIALPTALIIKTNPEQPPVSDGQLNGRN